MTSLLELQGKLSSCNGSASVWRRKVKHNLDDVREPTILHIAYFCELQRNPSHIIAIVQGLFWRPRCHVVCLTHDDHDKDHSVASSQLVEELERQTTLSETIQD